MKIDEIQTHSRPSLSHSHFSTHRARALIIFIASRTTTTSHRIFRSTSLICERNIRRRQEKVSVGAALIAHAKEPHDGAADASETHIPLVLFAIAAQVQPTAPRKER